MVEKLWVLMYEVVRSAKAKPIGTAVVNMVI